MEWDVGERSIRLFQSTRPRGARQGGGEGLGDLGGFNPRARVGRDLCDHHGLGTVGVSIHAPAWGATGAVDRRRVSGAVSIHAPAWGATWRRWYRSWWPTGFNPRARVGRDVADLGDVVLRGVSIHAPAWGATPASRPLPPTRPVSIHAPAWGATTAVWTVGSASVFQSTRPRGARHALIDLVLPQQTFQSTRPRGARRSGAR